MRASLSVKRGTRSRCGLGKDPSGCQCKKTGKQLEMVLIIMMVVMAGGGALQILERGGLCVLLLCVTWDSKVCGVCGCAGGGRKPVSCSGDGMFSNSSVSSIGMS